MIGGASRAAILGAIANALRDEPQRQPPQPAPLFVSSERERSAMLRLFRERLEELKGEVRHFGTPSEAAEAVARFFEERGIKRAAIQDCERVLSALARVEPSRYFVAARASKIEIESADCAIVEAHALLADTGSVLLMAHTYGDRLLPYLPRTCVIIADTSQLHPHMVDEALRPMFDAARSGKRGEACFVSGPSRSADIEKTLVLGAHGPQSVVVFLAENAH